MTAFNALALLVRDQVSVAPHSQRVKMKNALTIHMAQGVLPNRILSGLWCQDAALRTKLPFW